MTAVDAHAVFDAMYDRTHRQVLAYCVRRTPRWTDALDAAADTYVVAWRRFDDVPVGDEALFWLFGVARRVLANQRRGGVRRDRLYSRLRTRGRVADASPEDVVIEDEEHRDVLRALARLSDDDQELIRLTTFEGLAPPHVARLLGCSRNAVDVRLHRARRRLAREYERERSRGTGRPDRGTRG